MRRMAGCSKRAVFRCYQCAVDFEQERGLLRHFQSNKHKELEDIRNKVQEVQRNTSSNIAEAPVLCEETLHDASSKNWSLEVEGEVEEPGLDMDVSGSGAVMEQSVAEVVQTDESSADEVDMDFESLLRLEPSCNCL